VQAAEAIRAARAADADADAYRRDGRRNQAVAAATHARCCWAHADQVRDGVWFGRCWASLRWARVWVGLEHV